MKSNIPILTTTALLLAAPTHATAQWAVTAGFSSQSESSSPPLTPLPSDPTVFRSTIRNDNPGGYVRVERPTGSGWNYGIAASFASTDYTVRTFVPATGAEGGFRANVAGSVTTFLAQVGRLLTPVNWRTRVELVGGAGLIHLAKLSEVNPDERTSGFRPAVDIGVAVTQELSSITGIQAGYSALYYRYPTNQDGGAPSKGMKDIRATIGFRLALP